MGVKDVNTRAERPLVQRDVVGDQNLSQGHDSRKRKDRARNGKEDRVKSRRARPKKSSALMTTGKSICRETPRP